jgi:hypothetical protein
MWTIPFSEANLVLEDDQMDDLRTWMQTGEWHDTNDPNNPNCKPPQELSTLGALLLGVLLAPILLMLKCYETVVSIQENRAKAFQKEVMKHPVAFLKITYPLTEVDSLAPSGTKSPLETIVEERLYQPVVERTVGNKQYLVVRLREYDHKWVVFTRLQNPVPNWTPRYHDDKGENSWSYFFVDDFAEGNTAKASEWGAEHEMEKERHGFGCVQGDSFYAERRIGWYNHEGKLYVREVCYPRYCFWEATEEDRARLQVLQEANRKAGAAYKH